jgi:GTP-binding protein HflX
VRKVLGEIGAEKTPQILVLNKADLLSGDPVALAARLSGEAGGAPAVALSARDGAGLDALLELIDRQLPEDPVERVQLRVPLTELRIVHLLHDFARVIAERYTEDACELDAEVPSLLLGRLKRFRVCAKNCGEPRACL